MAGPSGSKRKPTLTPRQWVMYLLAWAHEQRQITMRLPDGSEHRRSEPQDYDPTPACALCHLAWDETGNYKPEYRCPASPGAMTDALAHKETNA